MKTRNLVIALGMVSSLAFLACSGEDGADGVNGADGTSCYAKALKDSSGFELYCGDEYVGTLKNGEDGAKGETGDKGDQGAPGENGRNGTSCTAEPLATKDGYKVICAGDSVGVVLNGTNGTNGTNGKNGENGLSAYEIAVANGFTGTEEEWLASLKGNPGADGKDGRNWMVDPRDGQFYKVVTIGEQTWMAHNLNYKTDAGSYCYNDSAKYCLKYGRLYTWAAAMDSVGTWSANGKGCGYGTTCSPTYPVRGVCPEGWHLPTKAEFEKLFWTVGTPIAGEMLKSTSGWNSSTTDWDFFGSDIFAFSALPAGVRNDDGYYYNEGYYAVFWRSTEYDSHYANNMCFSFDDDSADLGYNNKNLGYSVRCLKD